MKKSTLIKIENVLKKPKLPLHMNFLRWAIIDVLRGKQYPLWGIYLFVAKPGNGKTMSMVAHMERVKKEYSGVNIYTNFNYVNQNGKINNWHDIVDAPDNSIIAIDEIHMSFGSQNFYDFPVEILGEITQNRHSRKQFICSTQDYEMVNINFRRLCNYIVLCKNAAGLDRLFTNYYYDRGIYEKGAFDGKRSKAEFIRLFVADDQLYSKYDTLEKINAMLYELEHKEEGELIRLLDVVSDQKQLLDKETRYIRSIKQRIKDEMQREQEIKQLKKIIDGLQLQLAESIGDSGSCV